MSTGFHDAPGMLKTYATPQPLSAACHLVPSGAGAWTWHSKSEEESYDLAARVFAAGLLVVHNAIGSRQHHVPELTGRQQVARQLLDVAQGHVKTWRDDAAFVDPAHEVHDHFPGTVVVDDLHVADVSMLLHHLKEFDDDLGVRPDKDLALASRLGVLYAVEAVAEHVDADHGSRWTGLGEGRRTGT